MRGDVFDGRGFLKSAISGKEAETKSKTKNIDFDVDLKLGAVAGFNGEAVRSATASCPGATASIRSFRLTASSVAIRRVTGDMRGRAGQGRDVIYLETNDAGAFFRFTETTPR